MAVPVWFISSACLGALYVAAVCSRLIAYLALCLRRPKDLCRSYGSWAIITGPTSGLGRSMALELARRGLNLVLVDLNAANLRETSDTIKSLHTVRIKTVVFDLCLVATPQGDEAMRRLREGIEGLDVGLLVNNAAVNTRGALYLHEVEIERLVRMIRVNLWALTEVTAAVLPRMLERGRGAILNVGSGSTVAVPSFPLYTVYSSTKRYVSQFSRSLYVEYKSKGIDVQYQVPFYVDTGMLSSAVKAKLRPWFVATADEYTRTAARWIGNGPLCVPGAAQKLQWCLTGFVPDCVHDWYRIRLHLQHRAILRGGQAIADGNSWDKLTS
ncbi:very-long-chain 3-oxoacyl-CoA reductase 1-like [Phragmites australis]|uniref:very-long-chain 3-oxoacyl-CoA reductase 1-like n=1 Tax=Phragmites australis TaxID=29695 RepID=UPI002D77ABE6|nr:very-long-chain 3-oxoacyl-CoA reductase 1-like [Phragmites australis]XP_062228703.1 very-long-chain 3-oxoacyl-CoA reductase 1-like [Phragmites australis]